MILKHIYLDKTFLFFLVIIILTGNFNDFIVYFTLLLFHELGHTIIGIIMGYKLDKISFYPTGGITSFNIPLNVPLKKELLILIMGPIFQIITYFVLKKITNNYNLDIYHYTLLLFNLLPIFPLDGGRIINIIFCYKYNYLKSFKISFIISFIFITILFLYNLTNFNLNLLLMVITLLIKIIKIYKKKYYYYDKFLLERYLYNYSFKKIKFIDNIKELYRDKYHSINYIKEDEYLKRYFDIK